MRRLLQNKIALVLLGLLILIVVIPLIVFLVLAQQKEHMPGGVTLTPRINQTPGEATAWPIISRNVPAFASSGSYPASYANDDSYDTSWRSQGTPAWLAYDLSSVPASRHSKVLVVWYNDSYNYDHTINGSYSYNMPQDYTIDVNPAAGGGEPPVTGWVTITTVRGNHYHSRQHVIDMMGNNWIRINVTGVDGAPENYDVNINMDVYAGDYGTADDWIFFGDSITAGAMGHYTVDGVKSFAQIINAHAPRHFPVQEAGGIGFLKSADGAHYIRSWLRLFQGKYVVLSYGTNDALACTSAGSFYTNYVTMVQSVLNQDKIPIIPHIPWGRNSNIQNCAPALNTKIDALYLAYPQIIKGPDLWSFFQSHQNLISKDDIHPTDTGYGAYRQEWANVMLGEVYANGK
jgi:lysophospholipase L1-like esterase